jgi:DNA-binding transcriptional LysR family regulator
MELRHLRYLVAVAEELHFGRAAIRLNISQPPLSQQIRQLEEELGVRLFRRTKREVQLTEAGKRIVNEAYLVLSQVDHFTKVAAHASEGEIGHISIGAPGGVNEILVNTLRVFAKRFPGVQIELQYMSTGLQIEALREGRIQVGFLNLPVQEPSLVLETIKREQLWVALPKGHPLSRYRRLPLAALADQRFILFTRRVSPGLHDVITSACRTAGFSLNVAHEVDNVVASLTLVRADLGLAFCSPSMQRLWPEVDFRPIRAPAPALDYAVAYARDAQSPVLDSFLGVVRQNAHKK